MSDKINDLVTVEKAKKYGNPVESMESCARFWNLALRRMGWTREKDLTSREACELMILFKVSRDLNINDQDNITDIQGYAHIIDLITEFLSK